MEKKGKHLNMFIMDHFTLNSVNAIIVYINYSISLLSEQSLLMTLGIHYRYSLRLTLLQSITGLMHQRTYTYHTYLGFPKWCVYSPSFHIIIILASEESFHLKHRVQIQTKSICIFQHLQSCVNNFVTSFINLKQYFKSHLFLSFIQQT